MKRIIIIEDDSDLREMYAVLFRGSNYEVDEAADGESVQLLANKRYDAVLLDLVFPGQEGTNIIRQIRAPGSINQQTPIIVITNLEEGENTKAALNAGADMCLLKVEHTPRELFKKVNSIINNIN